MLVGWVSQPDAAKLGYWMRIAAIAIPRLRTGCGEEHVQTVEKTRIRCDALFFHEGYAHGWCGAEISVPPAKD